MKKPLIIGVAGGTGSGKTTIALAILDQLAGAAVALIPLDAYYRDHSGLSAEQRGLINYDHPQAIDFELLIEQIDALLGGSAVERPMYSFVTHSRQPRTVRIEPCDVLIVEGILALADERLLQRLDIKLYVETDDDIRFIRRLRRDVAERGRSVESVIEQYLDQVRPMHHKFVEPSRRAADLIVPEGGSNEIAIQIICCRIREALID